MGTVNLGGDYNISAAVGDSAGIPLGDDGLFATCITLSIAYQSYQPCTKMLLKRFISRISSRNSNFLTLLCLCFLATWSIAALLLSLYALPPYFLALL